MRRVVRAVVALWPLFALIVVIVLLSVAADQSGYLGWQCRHLPWSKGCWGNHPLIR